jgi:formylglycine-generating enzyme required for sulfatase activity
MHSPMIRALPAFTLALGLSVAALCADGGSEPPKKIPGLDLGLVRISPGTFMMGEPGTASAHSVTLTKPYWLGATEVTQGQWKAVMGNNPSVFKGDPLPVENLVWNDAMEFCRRLTGREQDAGRLPDGYVYTLPTEAQWEYACKAGAAVDSAATLGAAAWYSANSGAMTHPVATKEANPWGLSDMKGNVWEWCLDWYDDQLEGDATDPAGPASGSLRVLRGGGWDDPQQFCRAAFRAGGNPAGRKDDLGFRVALVPGR